MTDRFKQFVQEQKKQAIADAEGLTPEEDKERWLENLRKLGEMVEDWLDEYAKNGDIKVQTEDILLSEEQVGTYEAPLIKINIGSQLVKLKPIGTFLIGAYGRVDMEGPRGVCRLILAPVNSKGPSIVFNTATIPPAQPELVWKIATPPPTVKYIDLKKDSFLDEMMRVMQGA
jgi:hypothetical protein